MTADAASPATGARGYAPVLAGLFVLWPLVALGGGQGFLPLMGLAGLSALGLARPKIPPAPFAVATFAFVAWAVLSVARSPEPGGVFSGSIPGGDFAVESIGAVVAGVTGLATLAIAGALRAAPAPRTLAIIFGAFAVQFALVLASAVLGDPLIEAVYKDNPQGVAEGAQNLGRNANSFALVLPVLIAALASRTGVIWKIAAALLVALSLFAFVRLDTQAGILALGGMSVTAALVYVLPRMGFRWLMIALGAYIAAAPVLMGGLIRLLAPVEASLPGGFRSRLWSWEVVNARIAERPLMGHGLEATRTWRETYAEHPDWLASLPDFWAFFQVVPGHPHNMALQIWAETGLAGAVLAALACVALGFHLPRPEQLSPAVRYGAAGFIGAAACMFSFSYSMWNEGFWSGVVLIAVALILMARTARAPA